MNRSGLSKRRLDTMHGVMARHVDRGDLPGLVTLVARRGEVHVDAVGAKALGGEPVGRDTIFRISSMTKPVTAVATMLLVEECLLRLDDPVDGYLPELADRRVLRRLDGPLDDVVRSSRSITVRDLLTFTMGFGVVMAAPGTYPVQRAADDLALGQGPPSPATMPEPDEWIRRLGTLPLLHQPGERWMYNTGSDVLGVLVARASRRAFDAFLRERVFEPLGMHDTGFSVSAEKTGRLATGYWTGFGNGRNEVHDPAVGGQWSRPPAFPSGGAGLVSTVDDYLAFATMLADHGRYAAGRLLSRASVELVTTDRLTPAQKAGSAFVPGFFERNGWGFGVSVVTRRDDVAKSVGTYGWDGGLGTSWFTDPSEELVAILMTQQAFTSPDPPAVCRDFWTATYAAIDD
jgi:CubicO group peptidase (beta-lactamase class C family)